MSNMSALLWKLRRSHRDEGGFSILELGVAFMIFAIVMGGVLVGMSATLRLTGSNRYRSVAANLASQQMDSVRSLAIRNFQAIPVGNNTKTQSVDGILYTISQDTEWISQNANSSACDGAPGQRLAYLRVSVEVSWPNMQGVSPVATQSLLTPPVGLYDPNTGHIGVKLLDRDAQPVDAILVSLSGPQSRTEITTSDGCAFFAYLPAGTYTVSLNTAGYVDGQGNPAPSQVATVTIGSISSIQFDYDQAATLQLTLSGDSGGIPPTVVPLTLGNTHLLPNGSKPFPGSGGARTITNLFPYLQGYTTWAGDCLDADPEGQKADGSGPYYPGGQRAAPIQTNPASTSNGTVTFRTVRVHLKHNSGIPVAGATLQTYHSPDNGCAAGETLTMVGVTDVTGTLVTALPYGLWQFKAVGFAPFGSWPTSTLDPTKPSTPDVTIIVP
jgi:type II secretory pathway pseudopilin PulG